MEQFLSDKSADKTDSETGSSIGHYASGVVEECVQRGVDLKSYGRVSPVEEVPKTSESVGTITAKVPQTSEDEVFVVTPTSAQGANLQETILNVGQPTPENVPENAPLADSGKSRKRKALMSADTQEMFTRLFGKKGSMQIPPKDDDVFDDNRSDIGVSCTSGDTSAEADLEALDQMGPGSTVGGLSSSFSGVPSHSGIVRIEPGNSDEEANAYCRTLSQRPDGVTQSARAAIKDCFANKPCLSLPMGHPVVP